jgi:hypothetical protein
MLCDMDNTTTTTAPPAEVLVIDMICEEDDPCWNCETMGNMLCGPTAAPEIAEAVVIERPAPVPVEALPRTEIEANLALLAAALIFGGRFFVGLASRR